MRPMLIAMLAFIAGILVFSAPSHAAPGPVLAQPPGTSLAGWSRRSIIGTAIIHGYAPGAVAVVPAVPVVPVPQATAPVVVAPVLVPVRPASCGQYHYWNGVQCVDARYNNPYVGPR